MKREKVTTTIAATIAALVCALCLGAGPIGWAAMGIVLALVLIGVWLR